MKKYFDIAAKIGLLALSYIKRIATYFLDFLQKTTFTPLELKRPVTRVKEDSKKTEQNSYASLDRYYLTSISTFDKADKFLLSATKAALHNVKPVKGSQALTRQKELLTLIEDLGAPEGEDIFLWFPSVAIIHFFLLKKYARCRYETASIPEILLPTETLEVNKQKNIRLLGALLKEFLTFSKEKQSQVACEVFSFCSPEISSHPAFIKKIYEYATTLERDAKFRKALSINYKNNSWENIIN